MEKLYIDKWYKMPPKEKMNNIYIIEVKKRESHKKAVKARRKKGR